MQGEFGVGIPVKLKKKCLSGVKSQFSHILIRNQNDSLRSEALLGFFLYFLLPLLVVVIKKN